jgi:hypothetical protein
VRAHVERPEEVKRRCGPADNRLSDLAAVAGGGFDERAVVGKVTEDPQVVLMQWPRCWETGRLRERSADPMPQFMRVRPTRAARRALPGACVGSPGSAILCANGASWLAIGPEA